MKNYELINRLSKLPAGAEVRFTSNFVDDDKELDIRQYDDYQEIIVNSEITEVELQDNKILLF